MPTEAFYNLESSKKKQLIDSAIHEFSVLPYEKVSIFKIAQKAEVSRSGFYYYFKDKKDIYNYLIDEIKEEFIAKYNILNIEFDLFQLGKYIFDFIVGIKGTPRESLFRNIVQNMKTDDLKMFFTFLADPDKQCNINCRMDDLNINSVDELNGTVLYLASGIMYSLSGYLDNEYDIDTAIDKLDKLFGIIKYGITKGV